jgi:hypothetical protein
VTSANALPRTSSKNDSYGSDEDSDDDDEFGYLMAFPEFRSVCLEARSALVDLLTHAMHISLGHDSRASDILNDPNQLKWEHLDLDHPVLWDLTAETAEVLLDRVDSFMTSARERRMEGLADNKLIPVIKYARDAARMKAKGRWNDLLESLVDMEVWLCFYISSMRFF